MIAADAARRRHRDADHEQRLQQEAAGKRHVDAERARHQPRLARERSPRAETTRGTPARARAARAPPRSRSLKVRASAPSRAPSRRGSTRVVAATKAPMRSGCVASTHITPISTTPASAASAADTSIGRRSAGGSVVASAKPQTYDGQQDQHGDEVEHALHHDRGERGRARSVLPAAPADTDAADRRRAPAAATSAAKPMIVVRNAVRNRVGPIGASRYCQRTARTQNVATNQEQRRDDQARARVPHLRPDVGEVRATQEPREQGNRQKRHHRRSNLHRAYTIYQARFARRPVLLRTVASPRTSL